ncbi:MAG: DUF2306 domain-containing protein [Xanthobacteraceae bacterium]|nr:DUF2306 domain-containing protein [Xanthobacteraceae bacterium]
MSLAPLLNASPAIQIHAFAAIAAVVIGIVQFVRRKGTFSHRTFGWIWAVLMLTIAVTSFWINEIKLWGPWSPIHLLSIFVLFNVPLAVWLARRHNVRAHRGWMIGIFAGALVIAGIFTLVPGRIMHAVIIGG